MTHHTEAERAEFELDWQRRHHPLPMNTRLRDDGRYGDHIIQGQFETWQAARSAARRAPAAPVPQGWKPVPMEPTPEQLLKVYKQTGVSRKELADLWTAMLAAAPQPPDAFQTEGGLKSENRTTNTAPVQMPEPIAYLHECGKKPSLRTLEFSKVAIELSAKGYKSHGLYTEQQVRQLLAAHGIKGEPN